MAASCVRRGALVVLEGCDRCGKTTQCRLLMDSLQSKGLSAEVMRFPERSTSIGKIINDYLEKRLELDDRSVHLLFSANRWEVKDEMLKKLKSGTTLIVDRYAFSGVAFTAAKEGFSLDWCKGPDRGLPAPDVVLFFDLDPEEASKRAAFGNERYEKMEFQKRVMKNYHQLRSPEWKMINAGQTIEQVQADVMSAIDKVLDQCSDKNIGQLWTESS